MISQRTNTFCIIERNMLLTFFFEMQASTVIVVVPAILHMGLAEEC